MNLSLGRPQVWMVIEYLENSKYINSKVNYGTKLKRIALLGTYTIGRLYVDNHYFCDT